MPIHDWTRLSPGAWHDFHLGWVAQLRRVLNGGLLPSDYYSLTEQTSGPLAPDALRARMPGAPETEVELSCYTRKRRTITIRRADGDRPVAYLEIVSPGTKSLGSAFRSFAWKAAEALDRGCHLLLIDLFSPGPHDPRGMHAAIWEQFDDAAFEPPPGEPLTLAAYAAGARKEAYLETTAVGRALADMPLFLGPGHYVSVPLEATYEAALRGIARHFRAILEAPPA